jgi:RNA polymerase sigma-70 factor (ECF subfamily)
MVDIVRGAQDAWPTVDLPFDAYVAYLRERLPTNLPAPHALRKMHTADLYLACACARGDAHALAAFDDRCLRQLDGVLSKMRIPAEVIAEVKQDIRSRVLVGDGTPPKIVEFEGRGDLRSWVRIMAVRRALQHQSRARREVTMEDDCLLQGLVGTGDPEQDYAKGLYRRAFKHAFEGALKSLPSREITLLRQHYVDGLTIDELGALYRVHRATAARQLGAARTLLHETTRSRMMSRLRVEPQELDSIMRMIRSRIEISVSSSFRRPRR